jgi:hypothetical protein
MNKYCKRLTAALALIGLAWSGAARADLMLHPTRVVFDKGATSAQVDLINNGTEAATYRLRLVNRRMGETGEFSAADSAMPGELFAEPMLRFSPRQVTVPAGGAQTVRIMLRKGPEVAAGEYRSHLQFDRVAPESAPPAAPSAGAGKEIGIVLTALVGASMPIIVRQGATSAQVTLSELRLADGAVSMLFERSGTASVYGDLTVTFNARGAAPAAARQVASMGGVAVYTPNARRRASLPLTVPADVKLADGRLVATYRARADQGGAVLASAAIDLP